MLPCTVRSNQIAGLYNSVCTCTQSFVVFKTGCSLHVRIGKFGEFRRNVLTGYLLSAVSDTEKIPSYIAVNGRLLPLHGTLLPVENSYTVYNAPIIAERSHI